MATGDVLEAMRKLAVDGGSPAGAELVADMFFWTGQITVQWLGYWAAGE